MASVGSVVAPLEGMRVVISDGVCRLDEYNFVDDQWKAKDCSLWPMPRTAAARWLEGWNSDDRYAAFSMLVAPVEAQKVGDFPA